MTPPPDTLTATPAGAGLERRVSETGRQLAEAMNAVLQALSDGPFGPADLARSLGIDKVLASRMLKALRNKDPLAVAHLAPGPDPMRRLVAAAGRRGVPADRIEAAESAIAGFERLIRQEAGDRSALDAIIAAWLPEAREEFELRRKQSAFKAMSQLKGVTAATNLATVMLHPSDDGEHLDVVWVTGLLGLHRLRPGAGVKFATRRLTADGTVRQPTSLDGKPVDGLEGVRLDDFCSSPPPQLDVHRAGDVVHYTLAEGGFGPRSAVDLVFAEVNLAEMPRFVPRERNRKGYVFAEIATPVKVLHFDVFVHRDVYPGSEPGLVIYDTALDGVADVNDPARDIDRLEMTESIQPLGWGLDRSRSLEVPNYSSILRMVCDRMQWHNDAFRGYRCQIDHPIYGAQVAMTFDPPPPPGT